jgi:hypothetical protein
MIPHKVTQPQTTSLKTHLPALAQQQLGIYNQLSLMWLFYKKT